MLKTEKTVTQLKTIAMVAGLAIILWSLGLPYIQLAGAANVTNFSDTLSDSAPNALSNHTLVYEATSGVANGETIVLTFEAGFDLLAVDFSDIDLSGDTFGPFDLAATCGVGVEASVATSSGPTITLDLCAGEGGVIAADEEVTILIGLNASGGDAQIRNPGTAVSYDITLDSGSEDSGATIVAIVASVTVTAAVNTIFTFTVDGVGGGQNVNGVTTTGVSSSTGIAFGTLSPGVASTAAQDLTVETNASNGFVVTVQTDGPLESSTGADIDSYNEGSDTDTPSGPWSAPNGVIGQENTYGHWGITSNDQNTQGARASDFATSTFSAASTTPRIVMAHNDVADANEPGIGIARVGYQIEITSLQEAGDDYTTTLTYVATPSF